MDWAEKEVASLELSKRLKELGFPQNGQGWYWIVYHDRDGDRVQLLLEKERDKKFWQMLRNCKPSYREVIKAPTNSELGEWLPEGFHEFKLDNRFWIKNKQDYSYLVNDDIETNARARMVIWLGENGHISFK